MPICAIVGAGEGLGSALASKFAEEGFDLVLTSRSETGCEIAAQTARVVNPDATILTYAADAKYPETIEAALAEATSKLGDVEVLIYNVRGQFTKCSPLDMSYEALNNTFQMEVTGAFAAVKTVLPGMRERGRGTIFFSSATAAFRGSASYPLYAIGKFGLRALSQCLAKAYASDGVHIVHMRLDCDLDVPVMRDLYGDAYDPDKLANPLEIAQSYWLTHLQPRSAWSNEVDLRPHTETWTY